MPQYLDVTEIWSSEVESFIDQSQILLTDCHVMVAGNMPDLRQFYLEEAALPALPNPQALFNHIQQEGDYLEQVIANDQFSCSDKPKILWLLRCVGNLWPIMRYISALQMIFSDSRLYNLFKNQLSPRQFKAMQAELVKSMADIAVLATLMAQGDVHQHNQPLPNYLKERVRKMDEVGQKVFDHLVFLLVTMVDGLLSNMSASASFFSHRPDRQLGILFRQPGPALDLLHEVVLDQEEGLTVKVLEQKEWPWWLMIVLLIIGCGIIGLLAYASTMAIIARPGHKYGFMALLITTVVVSCLLVIGLFFWRRYCRQSITKKLLNIERGLHSCAVEPVYQANIRHYLSYEFVMCGQEASFESLSVRPLKSNQLTGMAPYRGQWPWMQDGMEPEEDIHEHRWLLTEV